jgi:hypothetical protein
VTDDVDAMSELPCVRLFVFKEGLLSRLGHDLRLSVESFEMTLETGNIVGRFRTGSIRVDGVMKGDAFDATGLSSKDMGKIEKTIHGEILQTSKFPEAVFEASLEPRGDTGEVRGSLSLLGRRRALDTVQLLPMGDRLVAKLTIEPTRWGIKPYKGLAGALKIQDRIDIEIGVAADFALDSIEARRWERQP